MLTKKFGHISLTFPGLVDEVRELCPSSQHLRAPAYYSFIADILRFFEAYPSLQTVVVLASSEIKTTAEPPFDTQIEIFHDIQITTNGATIPRFAENMDKYVIQNLPVSLMEAGSLQIERSNQRVQQYLSLPDDAFSEYESVVHDLALAMARAFNKTTVSHHMKS